MTATVFSITEPVTLLRFDHEQDRTDYQAQNPLHLLIDCRIASARENSRQALCLCVWYPNEQALIDGSRRWLARMLETQQAANREAAKRFYDRGKKPVVTAQTQAGLNLGKVLPKTTYDPYSDPNSQVNIDLAWREREQKRIAAQKRLGYDPSIEFDAAAKDEAELKRLSAREEIRREAVANGYKGWPEMGIPDPNKSGDLLPGADAV